MNDIVVTHNTNSIKLSTIINGEFKGITLDFKFKSFPEDAGTYAGKLQEGLTQLNLSKKVKPQFTFIIDPEEVISKFLTLTKNTDDAENKLLKELKAKFDGENLEDYFYSYEKIAPFVYQLIGIKKTLLEGFIEVANRVSVPLRAVVPWSLLLPKYVGSSNSSIFVCKVGDDPVVILSELGGVYFTGEFEASKSTKELNKVIQDLSVYKRSKPIDKLYSFNFPLAKDNLGFSVHNIEIPNLTSENTQGYEVNLLTHYMLDLVTDVVSGHINLLNLVPVPVVEKSKLPVPAKAVTAALVVTSLAFGVFLFAQRDSKPAENSLAVNPEENVLSEHDRELTAPQTSPEVVAPVVLERKNLKVRVENGSGINGVAGTSQTFLENLEYDVVSIDTAPEQRTDTLLRFKKSSFQYKDLVQGDTKDVYPTVAAEDSLPDSSDYDLLIIVGDTVKLE